MHKRTKELIGDFVVIVIAVLVTTLAVAQTYEKQGKALKVTQSVSTVYDIAKIKERIKDLQDYIVLSEDQIVKYNQEIEQLNKLLDEAGKLGLGTE